MFVNAGSAAIRFVIRRNDICNERAGPRVPAVSMGTQEIHEAIKQRSATYGLARNYQRDSDHASVRGEGKGLSGRNYEATGLLTMASSTILRT